MVGPAEAPRRIWYGWQTLSFDAGAVALEFAAFKVNPDLAGAGAQSLAIGGIATYLLGAPIVHAFHHHKARAGGSFLARLVAPVIGALAGAGGRSLGAVVGGAGLGIGIVVAYDAAFSIDERPSPAAGVSFTPTMTIVEGRPMFGLGGRF